MTGEIEGELVAEIGSKEEFTKKQWDAIKDNFVESHIASTFYTGEKFQNKAKRLGLPLDKFWEQNFYARLNTPGEHCTFVHPMSDPYKIVAIMFAEKVDEETVYLFSGSVIPEYQNQGLIRRMGRKVKERFPNTNIIWCVRPDNHVSRVRAAHLGSPTSLPISLGNKKLKKKYLYYVVSRAKL